MPHVGSSGSEDFFSNDEIKVYKDEGEEEKRSSENLSEDKLGLVTESEEGKNASLSGNYSSSDKANAAPSEDVKPCVASGGERVPGSLGYMVSPYPPYPNGASSLKKNTVTELDVSENTENQPPKEKQPSVKVGVTKKLATVVGRGPSKYRSPSPPQQRTPTSITRTPSPLPPPRNSSPPPPTTSTPPPQPSPQPKTPPHQERSPRLQPSQAPMSQTPATPATRPDTPVPSSSTAIFSPMQTPSTNCQIIRKLNIIQRGMLKLERKLDILIAERTQSSAAHLETLTTETVPEFSTHSHDNQSTYTYSGIDAETVRLIHSSSRGVGNFAKRLSEKLFPELFGPDNLRKRYSYNGGGIHRKLELEPTRKELLKQYILKYHPEYNSKKLWKIVIDSVNEGLRRPVRQINEQRQEEEPHVTEGLDLPSIHEAVNSVLYDL